MEPKLTDKLQEILNEVRHHFDVAMPKILLSTISLSCCLTFLCGFTSNVITMVYNIQSHMVILGCGNSDYMKRIEENEANPHWYLIISYTIKFRIFAVLIGDYWFEKFEMAVSRQNVLTTLAGTLQLLPSYWWCCGAGVRLFLFSLLILFRDLSILSYNTLEGSMQFYNSLLATSICI